MRRTLLDVLRCPTCGKALAERRDAVTVSAGASEAATTKGGPALLTEAELTCPAEHRFPVSHGVLHALPTPTPQILGQLAENARERAGQVGVAEKEAYRRYISQVGLRTFNELVRKNLHAALDEVAPRRGRSIDLGGGSGWLATELARRGFSAVSLDIEDPHERERQVQEGAATRGFELVTDLADDPTPAEVDFVVADMHRPPFSPGSFDLVTTSAALHHSEDPSVALRQAAALLAPGGVLLCINEPVRGAFRDTSPILAGRGKDAGEHIYSRREYLGFFDAAGLKVRLHFPGWVDDRLARGDFANVVYYRRLRTLISRAWQVGPFRTLCRGPLLPLGMDLFGLTLIAEARPRD